MSMNAPLPEERDWWTRLMRWLHAYEVLACPWCGGEVLLRDGIQVHMGDACVRGEKESRTDG